MGNKITLAIANDGHNRPRYTKACRELGINYKNFDIKSDGWQKRILSLNCDAYIWHPNTPAGKGDSIFEKVFWVENIAKKPVFPDSVMSYLYQDKIRQTLLLDSLKLPQPKTLITTDPKKSLAFINKTKYPIILKDPYSSGGCGNILVKTKKEAKELHDKIFSVGHYRLDKITYWQEFLNIKKEFRVITIDNKIVASYRREAQGGGWMSNVCLGGKVTWEDAPLFVEKLAKDFMKKVFLHWCGFDIAVTNDNKALIIELNTTFGADVLYDNGVDARKLQTEYVYNYLKNKVVR